MPEPKLPLTVDRSLWDAVAEAVRPTFADSYLSGASQFFDRLLPHTVTAYERLKAEPWAMKAIADAGLKLSKPLPFGHPDRPDTK